MQKGVVNQAAVDGLRYGLAMNVRKFDRNADLNFKIVQPGRLSGFFRRYANPRSFRRELMFPQIMRRVESSARAE